jgi:hypothetical protein
MTAAQAVVVGLLGERREGADWVGETSVAQMAG